jgi:hypothetical protein
LVTPCHSTTAEALGPDEYSRLEAFLEQGEGVVEVAGRNADVRYYRRGKGFMPALTVVYG